MTTRDDVIEYAAACRRGERPERLSDLRGVDLREADLRGAALHRADLRGAALCEASLRDSALPFAPDLGNIDQAILDAIGGGGGGLNMNTWHTCETTHCRAGWAIHLAGDAGRAMEGLIGPNAAAALIYAASGSHPVPNWYASNEDAIADMKERAERAQGSK